ncbi:signal peptidase I [Glutamicibacter arilaitensis]|uniref:signal peptidase I n=1 Tax=Glutamicibacter arilaitensis TaxID=256701 RepID=UPI00384B8AAC
MILVILGVVFNVSIMMFRTGSMSPTITAGSIAFVREVPATEIAVGDIVTVERGENILPVTHRVIEILETDGNGFVTFTMQGDANETRDVDPYNVSTVKTVLFSIPGVAPVIQWFSIPYVLGGLTVGASALVVWAFWPRKGEERIQLPQESTPQHFSLAVPASLLLATVSLFSAQHPEVPVKTTNGEVLRMSSSGNTGQMSNLSPEQSASWIVDVWAETKEPGKISLTLEPSSGTGITSLPLLVSVTECLVAPKEPFTAGCPSGSPQLATNIPLDKLQDSSGHAGLQLSEFGTADRRRVVVSGTLSSTAVSSQNQSASIRLTAVGMGEELSTSPDEQPKSPDSEDNEHSPLPPTGINGWQWVVAVGLILVATGATLFGKRRRTTSA